jgi:hypothetical protein
MCARTTRAKGEGKREVENEHCVAHRSSRTNKERKRQRKKEKNIPKMTM